VPISDTSDESPHVPRPLPVDLDTAGHLRIEID
jgi:hypothetical protein